MSDSSDKRNLLAEICYVRCAARLNTSFESLELLQQSGMSGNVDVFKTSSKRLIGYVAWISVTKETFNMMRKTNALPRYGYEANEGKLKVVFDVVFLPGWNRLGKEMIKDCIKKNRLIASVKRNKFRLIPKKLRT